MDYETVEGLTQIVEESIKRPESKLTREVAWLRGFSTPKIRHLLNNICSFGPCKYLEIGVWGGSTFIPAMFENDVQAVGIDNWSQFGVEESKGFDARESLNQSLLKYGGSFHGQYCLVNTDCFYAGTMESDIPKSANVFLYDGAHDAESTKNAIKIYGKLCHNPFVLVVDDWRLSETVIAGTEKALENFTVHKSWKLEPSEGYHMGLGIFVLERKE